MVRNRSLEGLSGINSMKFRGTRCLREIVWKTNKQKAKQQQTKTTEPDCKQHNFYY